MEIGKNIGKKLIQVAKQVPHISKGGRNETQRYNYVRDQDLMAKVGPALAEANLATVPETHFISILEIDRTNKSGNKIHEFLTTIRVDITVMDVDSGESVVASAIGQGIDPGDKGAGKAQTNAHKSVLLKLFNMAAGNDPEADEGTDRRASGDFGGQRKPQGKRPQERPADAKECPECKKGFMRKVEHQGSVFWGCSNYSKFDKGCKYTTRDDPSKPPPETKPAKSETKRPDPETKPGKRAKKPPIEEMCHECGNEPLSPDGVCHNNGKTKPRPTNGKKRLIAPKCNSCARMMMKKSREGKNFWVCSKCDDAKPFSEEEESLLQVR